MTQSGDNRPTTPHGGMTKRAIVASLVFFILVLASIIYFLTSPEAHHLGHATSPAVTSSAASSAAALTPASLT
ncbi:MAG: hypothetical protein Q4P33_05230 [Flaviflexus sp.]|nr:hypothetical protein [Flaviflexus sp.]